MSRKNTAYKRRYEHEDFSDLLKELKANVNCSEIAEKNIVQTESPIVEQVVYSESTSRHRILSDQNVKYLYSKNSNVIHDKHCQIAKGIPDTICKTVKYR